MVRVDSGFGDAIVVSDFLDKVLISGVASFVDEMNCVELLAEAIVAGHVDRDHGRYEECIRRSIMRNVVCAELLSEDGDVADRDTLFRWGVFMLEDVDGFGVDSFIDLVAEICSTPEVCGPVSEAVVGIKQTRVAEGLVYAASADELLASGGHDKRRVYVESANYITCGVVESESAGYLHDMCQSNASCDLPVLSRDVVLAMSSAVEWKGGSIWNIHAEKGSDGLFFPAADGFPISSLSARNFRLCERGPIVTWDQMDAVAFSVAVSSRLMNSDGYCYLRVIPPRDRAAACSRFGAFPTAGMLRAGFDVRGWIDVAAECNGGDVKHVLTCGRLPDWVSDLSLIGANSGSNDEVLASFDAVIRRLGDKARLETSTMASGSYGIPSSVHQHHRSSSSASGFGERESMTPRRLSGRGSDSLTLQVPHSSVGFSGVDQLFTVPSEDAARSNVRKTSQRADLLVSRLDTGACVSDKYMRSAAHALRRGKPVPVSGEPKGRVLVMANTTFGAGASPLDLSKLETLDMPGWVSRRISAKAGQVDVQVAGWARLDFCFSGDITVGDVVFSADRTVLWFTGALTFRARIDGSSKAAVWMSQPLVGMANAVGWEGMTLAVEYATPLIKPLVKDHDDVPKLALSLLQVGAQMAGLIRLRGEAKLKQVQPTRLMVSTDWDKHGFAVISISGRGLSHVTVAGVSVRAIDDSVKFITDAWHDAVVVSASVAGRLKFIVDMVGDKSVFETARAASPDTPVLMNYGFGS